GAGQDRGRHLRRLRELRQRDRQGSVAGVPACDTVRVMQRTRRTPLNAPASSHQGGDAESPEPADPESAGSPSSPEPGGGAPTTRSWRWMALFGGVGLLILFLDQLTKALALQHLTPGEPVNVIGSLLKFNLIRNSGAAFSRGAGYTPYISAVQITVAIGVVYLSRKLGSVG